MAVTVLDGAYLATAVEPQALNAPHKAAAPTQAADIPSARVAARLSGKRVEALSERTETSITWVNKDGSLTTELTAGPVRFRDKVTGNWRDVALDLVQTGDGTVEPKGHPRGLKLAGETGKPAASLSTARGAQPTDLVTLGDGDQQITLQWKGGLPKPKLDGTRAEYVNAVPGADVVVEATRTGFEQYVEIKQRPGSGGYSYTLPLKAKGLKTKQLADGSVLFTDRKNTKRAVMPAPVMWDASVDKRSGEHTRKAKVGLKVVQKGSSVDLVVTPDAQFLADPDTVFPVTVDPSTSSLSNVFDTYVQQGETVDWSADTELDLGNPGTKNADGTPRIARSFISWNTTPIQDALVLNAKLSLWNFHSSNTDCKLYPWEVWSTGAASTSSRWTAQPSWIAKKATSTETRGNAGCSTQPDGWINADVTTLVQEWASAKATRSHLGLRASDEAAAAQWKRVNSANAASYPPNLVVNYNYRPRTGTKQEAGPPYFSYSGAYVVNTTTPTLRDTFADPDNDKVQGFFQIADNATGTQVGSNLSSSFVPAGQPASVTVPAGLLTNGRTYKFRTTSYDGTHYNLGWSAWKTFTVDTTAPSAPANVTSTGYPTTAWVKGVGQAGIFTITPPAGTDHNWLEWSLDGVTWTKVATGGSSADKAVSITPPKNGTHTLQVRSVDKADNKSEAIEYTFHAGPGGFVQPADGERTARRLALVAEADAAKYDKVSFSWRRSEADAWVTIPAGDVTQAGQPLASWPVALTGGKNAQLVWDATSTVDPDGSIEIKADFTGPNSASGSTEPLTVIVDRNAQGAAPTRVGPGALNLLTGDFTLSESEASYFGLSVSRTSSSRQPDSRAEDDGQVAIFGNEWSSGISAETSGSDYAYVRKVSDTAVDVVTNNDDVVHFTANAAKTSWIAEPGAQKLTLVGSLTGQFTLTETDGSVTVFSKLDAALPVWNISSTMLDGKSDSTTTVVSETVSVNGAKLARPKRIVAQSSAVASATCAATPATKGCRVMEFVYAVSTTATLDSFGDYTGRVKEIRFWSTEPGASAATYKALQQYAYDSTGRLRQAWNPQISPALKTTYDYDSTGRVIKYNAPGDLPWTFTYGKAGSGSAAGDGMLLEAARPSLKQGTADVIEGEAVTSIVYDVPLTGTNAPYAMGAADVKAWGQIDAPTDATAIFPPDATPASHTGGDLTAGTYRRASIQYLGVSGEAVNSVSPGGHVSTSEHDRFGNIVRELTPGNRSLALGLTAADRADQAELGIAQLSGAERAELLSTRRIYDAAGTRKLEEFAPLHRLELTSDLKSGTTTLVSAGTSVLGRSWAVNVYDEGRPTDGTATVKDQVTRTITGVQVREHPSVQGEQRITQTVYDWVIGLPVKSIQDPDGLALTTVTEYDSQGRVRKEIPPAAMGTDAATQVTTYWSASGSGSCAGRPEWADLLCSTGPAGTVTGGGSNPAELVTSTTEYNWWGGTAKVTETANGVTRTTTTSYDGGGRPVKSTVTGGLGAALPEVTTEYSQDSGRPVKTVSTTGGTITRVFDKLGRQISYTDADGGVTTVEFDKLDRPVKVADSVPSTTTYTYDDAAEPRGLATSFTDSVAGVFRTSYDADGSVVRETLPGGFSLNQEKDPTGSAVSRVYTRDSDGTVVYSNRTTESVHGQVTSQAGWSEQSYTYDAPGRLTSVDDTADTVCTRRVYGFDKRSNRTTLTTAVAAPGLDCTSTGGTARTTAYDSADRVVGTGWTYDALGRATSVPGHGTLGYYANNLAYQQTANGQRQTWQLDADLRFRSWKVEKGSGTSWTQTASKVNHYDSDDDTPRWIVEDTSTGAVTRNIQVATGGLAATTGASGDTVLQLTDLHGDVALQLPLDASAAPVVLDNDEYGNPRGGQSATRYGWLGEKQRSTETLTGLTLMGVRLYDPAGGRFLQPDPIPGGSANAYDYSNADPCNSTDTDGMSPKCGKRRIKNGYGMRIIVSRRGGGVAKNGYRYMGYYINVQVTGFANRYLAFYNATYAETWGTPPGKRGKMRKLQSKGSWMNLGKLGWAVHYNIQVKPGTRIWTYGAVFVSGWNGYAADMSYSCTAAS
ncbi:DNRLRE domain-containing protein [Streptomyces sp. NPDC046985]|uniref:DNRLRE domain-containing protein n=1 Tax=Streptomyces sp. NPDC046985 TaxID=3155377 RepID=UPI0033C47637